MAGNKKKRRSRMRKIAVLSVMAVICVLGAMTLCIHGQSIITKEKEKQLRLIEEERAVKAEAERLAKEAQEKDTAEIEEQEKKLYKLSETTTVAPVPNADNFGTVSTYQEFLTVLESASELVDGKTPVLTAETRINENFGIQYYCDETILVYVWQEYWRGRTMTCAETYLADATQLQRKLSEDTYGTPIQKYPSDMSRDFNAVFAVSGDFYKFQNTGIHVYDRTVYRADGKDLDTCFFDSQGNMLFVYRGELDGEDAVTKYVEDNDILFSVSFGPVLTDNGEAKLPEYYLYGHLRSSYARSAMAQVDSLHYYFVDVYIASTGRELLEFVQEKNLDHCYELDGGQSATMLLNHEMVNPTQWGSQRTLSDIICFATALQ